MAKVLKNPIKDANISVIFEGRTLELPGGSTKKFSDAEASFIIKTYGFVEVVEEIKEDKGSEKKEEENLEGFNEKALQGLRIADLRKLARRLGVEFDKETKREELIAKILETNK